MREPTDDMTPPEPARLVEVDDIEAFKAYRDGEIAPRAARVRDLETTAAIRRELKRLEGLPLERQAPMKLSERTQKA